MVKPTSLVYIYRDFPYYTDFEQRTEFTVIHSLTICGGKWLNLTLSLHLLICENGHLHTDQDTQQQDTVYT